MPICPPCQDAEHADCIDTARPGADSRACYCQHQPRRLAPPDQAHPSGDGGDTDPKERATRG